MKKNEFLMTFKHSTKPFEKLNYMKTPVIAFKNNIEGMQQFNKVYLYVKNILKLNKMVRTESNGISVSHENRRNNFNSYSVKVRSNGAGVELVVVMNGTYSWRFQWRQQIDRTGHRNFRRFCEMCKNHGIDLKKYSSTDGKYVKKEIEAAPIKLGHDIYREHWWKSGDIHHIDINSSYPTGLMKAFPEFEPVIKKLYREKKNDDVYKNVMNHTIGFMQSKYVGYRYAKLSKAAIDYNNNRLREIAQLIKKNNGIILLYNTDGIWYKGKLIHSEEIGNDLGQWKYDYKNVKEFHIKSVGCYEFIDENGNYVSKARGIQKELLHKMGDIDKVHGIRKFWFDIEKGICYES